MTEVLVVDDSSTVRNEVSSFLSAEGISVETAVDGLDGLAKIEKISGLKLIICDIYMPNMDGLAMAERLKASGNTVPIIMLTTEGSVNLKQRGKAAGVRGWIVKPFDGKTAIGGIKRMVGR